MNTQTLTKEQSCAYIQRSSTEQSGQLLLSPVLIDAVQQVVFKKLLDWIERCDDASQQGLPKPPFQTADGEAIFPESIDEEWWKTDIARRSVQAELPHEEDGPISAEEDIPSLKIYTYAHMFLSVRPWTQQANRSVRIAQSSLQGYGL